MFSGRHLWYGRFLETTWNKAVEKVMDEHLCAERGLARLTRRPTPHDLRHTHASWLIAAGMPLPYVQARLGHEKITTTADVYGHLVPDAHERLAFAIEQTLDTDRPAIGDGRGATESEYILHETDVYDADIVDAVELPVVDTRLAIEPTRASGMTAKERDAKVRSLRGEGLTQRDIAARLGIGKTTVARALDHPAA